MQTLVDRFIDRADRRGREAVPAQRLGHRLDLARRNALNVHLGQGADQRLLRALIALEQFGRKPSPAVLHLLDGAGSPQLRPAHFSSLCGIKATPSRALEEATRKPTAARVLTKHDANGIRFSRNVNS